MTPAELTTVAQAYSENKRDEYKLAIIQAYMSAGLQRAKKMPKLETLLGKAEKTKKQKQNAKELYAAVEALQSAFEKKGVI